MRRPDIARWLLPHRKYTARRQRGTITIMTLFNVRAHVCVIVDVRWYGMQQIVPNDCRFDDAGISTIAETIFVTNCTMCAFAGR